ncbi:MAG TPA: hypothetical protein VF622_15595 [Segetibacter sp.]|jgi:hypothetical protein
MTELLSMKEIRKLDSTCKKKKQFIGRFVSEGFADRSCIYIIADETKTKYVLKFVWGETVNPIWGHQVKMPKADIEALINGRDEIETIFPRRN